MAAARSAVVSARHLKQVFTAQCLAALSLGVDVTARAEIWGYVDDTRVARISAKKIDDRYQHDT